MSGRRDGYVYVRGWGEGEEEMGRRKWREGGRGGELGEKKSRNSATRCWLWPRTFHRMRARGDEPPVIKLGKRTLIRRKAAKQWLARRERIASATDPYELHLDLVYDHLLSILGAPGAPPTRSANGPLRPSASLRLLVASSRNAGHDYKIPGSLPGSPWFWPPSLWEASRSMSDMQC